MIHFEEIYRKSPDPWHVRTSWYEQRKRALLTGVLPQSRYGRAMELACGNGEATRALARRCDALIAVDVSATAASLCEETVRNDGLANVRVVVACVPADWPLDGDEAADLIVVAELAYYLSEAELKQLIDRCSASLAPGGEWVMCHFTGDFPDRTKPTADIHAWVDRTPGLTKVVSHQDELFQLDVWRKC
jgi:cyclopropane fatty-acyl-phospholipid synthase-like methyltransferase